MNALFVGVIVGVLILIPVTFAIRMFSALFYEQSRNLIKAKKVSHFEWLIVSTFSVFILLSISASHELKSSPARAQAMKAVPALKYLHLAIFTYHADAMLSDDKKLNPYPRTLQELVTLGYMPAESFSGFTSDFPITYHEPSVSSPDSFVLLEVSTPTYSASINLAGASEFHVCKTRKE